MFNLVFSKGDEAADFEVHNVELADTEPGSQGGEGGLGDQQHPHVGGVG